MAPDDVVGVVVAAVVDVLAFAFAVLLLHLLLAAAVLDAVFLATVVVSAAAVLDAVIFATAIVVVLLAVAHKDIAVLGLLVLSLMLMLLLLLLLLHDPIIFIWKH